MRGALRGLRKQGSEALGIGREDSNEGFSVEGLFDYINENAASLAKVLAARTRELDVSKSKSSLPRQSSLKSRRMSVMTTVSNKQGKSVRFLTEVEVYPLPAPEGAELNMRRGTWGKAPKHDEFWDGETRALREAPSVEKHVDVKEQSVNKTEALRAWLENERMTRLSGFQEMIAPLFRRKTKSYEEYESGSDKCSNNKDEDKEDNEELEVRIELVETNKNQKKYNDNQKKSKNLAWREARSAREQFQDPVDMYRHTISAKRFEYTTPLSVKGKSADVLLKQNVLSKGLSQSQAAAAAAAGRVMILKSNSGKTFGAAVKRKVNLKGTKMQALAQAGSSSSSSSSSRKNMSLVTDSERSRNTGLHMRPLLIFLFFIFPLILIGLDDVYPYIEHWWHMLSSNSAYRYKPETSLTVPIYIRLLWPNFLNEKWLKRTYKIGSYVMEVSGLIVIAQIMYAWVILFALVHKSVKVRARIDSTTSTLTRGSSLNDIEDALLASEDQHKDANYAFLFSKWKPATAYATT